MGRVISVEELTQRPVEATDVEIVERKGRGHPDYISDGSSEAVSRALCKYYRREFGIILHHNVDKGLVVGGRSHPFFGGGEVDEPIYVIVAGRATTHVSKDGESISVPIGSLSLGAIRDYLRETFRFLDVDRHVIVDYKIREGSTDLVKTFQAGKQMPLANDSSFGVCFAPLTQTEKLVLETELHLNSPRLKKELPEVGEDIKVAGLRRKKKIDLTIAAAIISSLTPDLDHYLNVKEEIKNRVADLAAKMTSYPVNVYVNTADDPKAGRVYLTVTGTSAEHGDDGNTGRGNRVHGLITPCRPMSLEATAGKNPVNHVGKIYNVLAKLIAYRVYGEVKGIEEVYVKILSQIGMPIDEPMVTGVQCVFEGGATLSRAESEIEGIVNEQLNDIRQITDMVVDGRTTLF